MSDGNQGILFTIILLLLIFYASNHINKKYNNYKIMVKKIK